MTPIWRTAAWAMLTYGIGCTGSVQPGIDTEVGSFDSDPDSVVEEREVALEPDEPVATQAALIDEYIDQIEFLPVEEENVSENHEGREERDGDYVCQTVNFSESKQYDKIAAYAANSESLWPGAIVSGDSVFTGLFTQVVLPRDPLTFSVSYTGFDEHVSATMEEPSLSAYREALAGILDSDIIAGTPANMSFEMEQVHSKEQLELSIGVGGSYAGASLDIGFDFSRQDVRSRYVVRYYQNVYTVDIDQPQSASDLFAPETTLEEVQDGLPPGDPPTYVSSITYGRMILFTIESSFSSEEIGAALNFAYEGTGFDVHADISVGYKEMLNESSIHAYILGGDSDAAAQALTVGTYEELVNLIGTGASLSAESQPAPIAYKLAYLKDNSPGRFSLSTDYDVTICDRVNQGVYISLQGIEVEDEGSDAGNELEIYGDITAWGTDGESLELWDTSRSQSVGIEVHNFWPAGGNIEDGVVNAEPVEGSEIILEIKLTDDDSPFSDDSFGTRQIALPFEEGWRHEDKVVRLTADGMVVNVHFSIRPI